MSSNITAACSVAWTGGDDDYRGNILEVLPQILGRRKRGERTSFENFEVVEDFLGLPGWLRDHNSNLYAELYGGQDAHGNVIDDLQAAARQLGLRTSTSTSSASGGHCGKDPPQAISSAKELPETVFKAILDLTGTGKETRLEL